LRTQTRHIGELQTLDRLKVDSTKVER